MVEIKGGKRNNAEGGEKLVSIKKLGENALFGRVIVKKRS